MSFWLLVIPGVHQIRLDARAAEHRRAGRRTVPDVRLAIPEALIQLVAVLAKQFRLVHGVVRFS